MNLGPRFWQGDAPTGTSAYPHGWAERVAADERQARIKALGSIAYVDWRYLVLVQMIKTNVVAKRIRAPFSEYTWSTL